MIKGRGYLLCVTRNLKPHLKNSGSLFAHYIIRDICYWDNNRQEHFAIYCEASNMQINHLSLNCPKLFLLFPLCTATECTVAHCAAATVSVVQETQTSRDSVCSELDPTPVGALLC